MDADEAQRILRQDYIDNGKLVGLRNNFSVTRERIAKAIHESRPHQTPWEDLPESDANPQRYYARLAADAVLNLPGAGESISQTNAIIRARLATDKPMSEAPRILTTPPIPDGLCGAQFVHDEATGTLSGGCVFTPHLEGTPHSWQT